MISPKVLMLLSTAVCMLSESVNGHIHQNSSEVSKNTADLDIEQATQVITDSAIYLNNHHGRHKGGTGHSINRGHDESSGTEENAAHSPDKINRGHGESSGTEENAAHSPDKINRGHDESSGTEENAAHSRDKINRGHEEYSGTKENAAHIPDKIPDTDKQLNRSATHGNSTLNPETTRDSIPKAVLHGSSVLDEKKPQFQNQESDEVKITNKNVSSKKYSNTTQNILEKLNMTIDKHYDNLFTISNTSTEQSFDNLDHSTESPPVDTSNVSEHMAGAARENADSQSHSSETHTAGVAHTPNETATNEEQERTGHMHQHQNIRSQSDTTDQHLRSQTDSDKSTDNSTAEQSHLTSTQDTFEKVDTATTSKSDGNITTGGPIRTSSENYYEISDVRSKERNLDIGTSEDIKTTTNLDHGVGLNISGDPHISKETPNPSETTTRHISTKTQTSGNRTSKLASVESAYSVQLQPVMLTIKTPEFENKLQMLHTEDEVYLDQDMKVLGEKISQASKALRDVNLSTTEDSHLINSLSTTANGLALTETITGTSHVFSVPTTDWNNATILLGKTVAPTTAPTTVPKLSTPEQFENGSSQQTNLNSTETFAGKSSTVIAGDSKTRDSAPLSDFSNNLSTTTDQVKSEMTKDPTTDQDSHTLTQKDIELIIQRLRPHILSQQNLSFLYQQTEGKIAQGVDSSFAEVFQGLLMLVENMKDSQREEFLAQIIAVYTPFLNDEMSRMLNSSPMTEEKERPVDFVELPMVQSEHNITENTICIQMNATANCILLTANLLEYSTWHMADTKCRGLGGQIIQMHRTDIQEPVESFLSNLASKTLNGTSIWIDTHGEPTTEAGLSGNSSCPLYHIGKTGDKRLGHADCAVQIPFVCQRIEKGCYC